jgi:hypothetical protein
MRRLILLALLTSTVLSCKKEEVKPTPAPAPTENEACKCGIVTNNVYYSLSYKWGVEVQNNCSGNKKYFTLSLPIDEGSIYCAGQTW